MEVDILTSGGAGGGSQSGMSGGFGGGGMGGGGSQGGAFGGGSQGGGFGGGSQGGGAGGFGGGDTSMGGENAGAGAGESEGGENAGAEGGNSATPGSDMNRMFASSPWGRLSEVGINGFDQVFSGEEGGGPISAGSGSMSESPYGGNPFAGDNFWNTFAGGVNPSDIRSPGLGGSSSGGSPIA